MTKIWIASFLAMTDVKNAFQVIKKKKRCESLCLLRESPCYRINPPQKTRP